MKKIIIGLFLSFSFTSFIPAKADPFTTTKDNITASQIYKYKKLCSRDDCFDKVKNGMTLKEVEKKLGGKLFYIKTGYDHYFEDDIQINKLYGCRIKGKDDIFFTIVFWEGSKNNPREGTVRKRMLEFISDLNGNMPYNW